ncbi:MAG: peptidylprolyl isomerase [Clostridia bacterium]|nr:peptidylprolyl isomerase [Clostridia bacterium]
MSNKKRRNLKPDNMKSQGAETEAAKKAKTKKIVILTACALAVLIAVLGIAFACIYNSGEEMGTGACEYLETRDITGRDIKYVEMCVEDYGKVVILLDATNTPKTVENFLNLVNQKFYDGLTFHNVIKDTLIQGGDPLGTGYGESTHPVKGEFAINGWNNEILHKRGVISMARDINADCDSATCQFFICTEDLTGIMDKYETPFYDGNFAAFGYVVEGMSVIDRIAEDYEQYNGVIEDKTKQPVIKYIRQLSSWSKP